MMRFSALLMALPAFGQITVSISHQPLEACRAALGSCPKGVGIYRATACSATAAKVSEGRLIQAIETKVAVLDPALTAATAAVAKRRGPKAQAVRIIEYASLASAGYLTGGDIAPKVATALLGIHAITDKLRADADSEAAVSSFSGFLLATRTLSLDAGACDSRLALGEYRGSFPPFQVRIEEAK